MIREGESISAVEFDRLSNRYVPLATAVRALVAASLRTGADADTIHAATSAIDAVTALLVVEHDAMSVVEHAGSRRPVQRHEVTGRPVVWSNPVVGVRNPLAPPLIVHHESDGHCWSEFTLGDVYEGPPGLVHGGICALVLDQLLGEVATDQLMTPRFTGTISVRYLRGTPLGPLRAEAFVDRHDNHKTYARGFISDAQGTTVEAEGVFIMPAWARDGPGGQERSDMGDGPGGQERSDMEGDSR